MVLAEGLMRKWSGASRWFNSPHQLLHRPEDELTEDELTELVRWLEWDV